MVTYKRFRTVLWLFFIVFLASCQPQGISTEDRSDGKIKVVATTTIVSDVVHQIGGDHIALATLLPAGADPHGFEPSPQDLALVSEAQVVFANGGGLEEFLTNLIESADAQDRVVYLSDGIELITGDEEHVSGEVGGDAQDLGGGDPHTWMDPNNVVLWVDSIQAELSALDPQNAERFKANASSYQEQLRELHGWIAEQTGQVPEVHRALVTDHLILGYFARRYGFEQIGALIPGYSSMAQPSASELAKIEDTIRSYQVPAIFVGNTVNPDLAQRVTQDTGTQLVFIYTGSLSEAGGEAGTYLDYMRYNTQAIVNALK